MRALKSRRLTNAGVLLCFILATTRAWPCLADDKDEARKKFGEGVGLVRNEEYLNALAAFEEAYRLYPNATSLINIAMCLKELDRYTKSITAFERFLAHEGEEIDDNKRQTAEAAIREMKQLVARLNIQGAPPGAEVSVDGLSQGHAPLVEPLTIDPGEHTVDVAAEGYQPLNTVVTATSGAKITVDGTLEPVETDVSVKHEVRPVVTPSQAQPSEPISSSNDNRRDREKNREKDREGVSGLFVGGVVTAGLGVAAGALGIAFNVKGNRDFEKAKTTGQQADAAWSEGDKRGGEEFDRTYNDYRADVLPADRVWMIAGYTAAGVCLVTGVVLFIIDAKEKEKTKVAVNPAPGGLELRF